MWVLRDLPANIMDWRCKNIWQNIEYLNIQFVENLTEMCQDVWNVTLFDVKQIICDYEINLHFTGQQFSRYRLSFG